MEFYFVIRTDLAADSGRQRCFGVFDTESEAAAFAIDIAGHHVGDFAVAGPAPVAVDIVRHGGVQPVVAVPKG